MSDKYSQYARKQNQKGAHGITLDQLDDIHEQQVHGEVEMVQCNKSDEHQIPAYEAETFFLVEVEAPLYSSQTGKRLSTPKVKKFHIRQYRHMIDKKLFTGQTTKVLHNPEQYKRDKDKGVAGEFMPEDKTAEGGDGIAKTTQTEETGNTGVFPEGGTDEPTNGGAGDPINDVPDIDIPSGQNSSNKEMYDSGQDEDQEKV